MPEADLIKTDNGFKPVTEDSRKSINRVSDGEVIHVQFRKYRNYENHKRFFAFVRATFDMQEHFEEPEHYRRWLIMKAGYYSTCVAPNGNTMFFADSISFETLDDEEKFKKLFSACIDVFLREFGNGMTENELLRVVDFV